MLCDICRKNEATIHINEIINGKSKAVNLCAECAEKQSKSGKLSFESFNLGDFLYNLKNSALGALAHAHSGGKTPSGGKDTAPDTDEAESGIGLSPDHKKTVCPVCRRDYEQIRQNGQLGCAGCYKVFHELVEDAVKSVQKGNFHLGKHPSGGGAGVRVEEGELRLCREELKQAVELEDYERAAELRDRIRELERILKKPSGRKEKKGAGKAGEGKDE